MARPFRAILAEEGVETNEGMLHRRFDRFTWREPPLTMMAQLVTEEGHDGAVVAGRIDTITRDGNLIVATGELDDGDEAAARVVRLVEERMLNKISVDPGSVVVEEVIRATDDDGFPTDVLLDFIEYEIGAATIVNVPAIDGTMIELTDASEVAVPEEGPAHEEAVAAAVVPPPAAAAAGPTAIDLSVDMPPNAVVSCVYTAPERAEGQPTVVTQRWPLTAAAHAGPPADWFADPELTEPTALTVADDGRVFGHLATWGVCHIGRTDICLEAPPSQAAYAHFLTSTTRLADGTTLPTGRLTAQLDGTRPGHADIALDARAAAAHYDSACTAWAEVAAGEDDHGIWVAGAVLPDVDDLTLYRVRGLSLSGDWRRLGGSLELVAALSVNTPGFPIPRNLTASASVPRVRLDGGECVALVAAGVVRPVTALERLEASFDAAMAEVRSRLDAVERVAGPLRGDAAAKLRQRITDTA